MKSFYILNLTVLFLMSGLILDAQQVPEAIAFKTELKEISSINPDNENYEDLRFLEKEMKGVRILMLGEQGHGDGSSFLAKTRLIKYLHQDQGFDVLIFESGLQDMRRVWTSIKNGSQDITVFNKGLFPIWTRSIQMQSLLEYVVEQSKALRPLEVAGFDVQPTGASISPPKRWEELESYLVKTVNLKESDFPFVQKVMKDFRVAFNGSLTNDDFLTLQNEFKALSQEIHQNDSTLDGKIMSRYVLNLRSSISLFAKADFKNPGNTPHILNTRDEQMAANLEFLLDEVYPNKKVIVRGANTHLGYARGYLDSEEDYKAIDQAMVPMGHYLKTKLLNQVYSINFTSSGGTYGRMGKDALILNPADKNSLEGVIKEKIKSPYAFLVLRTRL